MKAPQGAELHGPIRCIWCRRVDPDAPPEHVTLASLGCPDEYTIRGGGVCRRCNKRASYLDAVLAHELDTIRFFLGVRGRDGKPPTVMSRPNLRGRYEQGRPMLYVNGEKRPVADRDIRLSPAGRSPKGVGVTLLKRPDGTASIRLQHTVFESPKIVEALHKVAFTALAFDQGVDYCLSSRYDEVRRFVHGPRLPGEKRAARRRALWFMPAIGNLGDSGFAVDGSPREVVTMRLLGPAFTVDLSPAQEHFDSLVAHARKVRGDSGWSVLPYPPGTKRPRFTD